MNNKVLVELYVPLIEKKYEVFLPAGKKIGEIIILITKGLVDISNNYYQITNKERLYNHVTGKEYSRNQIIKNTDIRNGSQLVIL